ncbi:MAG: uracil-DNA glycosylase [Bacillota bacterium]
MIDKDEGLELDQKGLDLFPERDFSVSAGRSGADRSGPVADSSGVEFLREMEEIDDLEELERLALACQRCHLRGTCNGVVFGEGSPGARLVFVGEAPGADEDRQGRPFVGRAGRLLDRIFGACDLERGDVYITNIVKCRPPGNRTPTEEERNYCIPYLQVQMRLIQPDIIVTMGAAATQGLIDPRARITRMRGSWQWWHGIRVMPTFHPAALLRDPNKKAPVWEDMKKVLAYLESGDE